MDREQDTSMAASPRPPASPGQDDPLHPPASPEADDASRVSAGDDPLHPPATPGTADPHDPSRVSAGDDPFPARPDDALPFEIPPELTRGGLVPVLRRSLFGAAIGLVPLAGFYAAQRLGGVTWAVGVGVVLTLAAFPFERRATGANRWAWIGLAGVALGAVLALVSRDPKLFFLRVVVGDAVWGVAMLGSLVIGKPLLGHLASWVVSIPEEYKATRAYQRSFGLVTFVWGAVTLARGGLRGWLLVDGSLESFLGIQVLTGWPVFAVLLAFAIWYPRRTARRYVDGLAASMTAREPDVHG